MARHDREESLEEQLAWLDAIKETEETPVSVGASAAAAADDPIASPYPQDPWLLVPTQHDTPPPPLFRAAADSVYGAEELPERESEAAEWLGESGAATKEEPPTAPVEDPFLAPLKPLPRPDDTETHHTLSFTPPAQPEQQSEHQPGLQPEERPEEPEELPQEPEAVKQPWLRSVDLPAAEPATADEPEAVKEPTEEEPPQEEQRDGWADTQPRNERPQWVSDALPSGERPQWVSDTVPSIDRPQWDSIAAGERPQWAFTESPEPREPAEPAEPAASATPALGTSTDRPLWGDPETLPRNEPPQWSDPEPEPEEHPRSATPDERPQWTEPAHERPQWTESPHERPQWTQRAHERPQRTEQPEWRPAEREIPPPPERRRRPAPIPVFTAPPRPPVTGKPTADSLDPEFLLRGRRNAPSKGWRRMVYKASGGWIKPGEPPEVRRRRGLLSRARTPVTAGHHRVAVLSLKGGVGKTTTTVGLGATLAATRGDRVIAVDANPDRGTLSDKLVLETSATVRDLLNERDQVRRYVDIRAFTSQAPSRLEVLASDRDPAVSEAFSGSDYQDVSQVLENFYSICITDCGTGLLHSAMGGVLGLADQIVLVSSPSVDGARAASATLDWLEAHHYGDLVKNATVVLCSVRPRSKSAVDIKKLEAHFAARCRAVIRVPYDPHLEEGAEIDLDRLQEPTRDAYLQLAACVGDGFAGIRE
ncbi:nucleotide-binding protein [Nonomuraea sp. NPDC002799]